MGIKDIRTSTVRYCKAEGCDRQAYVPGSGLGYCGKHYDKFKKYGDPLFVKRVRNRCTADDCDKYVKSDGLCSKHYSRLRRNGNIEPSAPWVDLPPELKWCTGHQAALPREQFGGKGSFCRPCVAAYMRERRKQNPAPLAPKALKTCAMCGEKFTAPKKSIKHCSPDCTRLGKKAWEADYAQRNPERLRANKRRWEAKDPEGLRMAKALRAKQRRATMTEADRERDRAASRRWAKNNPQKASEGRHRYRARMRRARIGRVSIPEIFRRDQWACGICGARIDPALRWPDPMSASVDHIQPLARGGAHSMGNLQAAHLSCNIRKGASFTPS